MVPDVTAVSRRFDYTVPERWRHQVRVGWRVRVPLHGRRVAGWVIDDAVAEPPAGVALQPLAGVSGLGPPAAVLSLAEWAAWRWAGPLSTLLRAASPDRNVWSLPPAPALPPPATVVEPPPWLPGAPGTGTGTGVWRLPPTTDPLTVVLAVLALDLPGSVVVAVPAAGWADRLAARLRRQGVPVAGTWAEAAAGWPVVVGARTAAWAPVPRLAAALVFDAHDEAYGSGWPGFNATEVLVERARRHQVPCVLVSPCPTAVLVDRHPVVAPPREVERAGWPAVSVVDRRGADPRTGLYSEELVRLVRRVLDADGRADPGRADPGRADPGRADPGLADPGRADPGRTGGAVPRVVCVLNRTGRARLLACATCRSLARCERCGRPVEQVDGRLICRGCGSERPVVCAACGATRLKVLRVGVSRAREELEALLGTAVGEVAGPAARRGAGGGVAPLEEPLPTQAVLVGTEAVLHRVRHASAVAFLDFDQHLLAPRFAAGEQALALLCRAGRLVGGRTAAGAGTVLVQTRMPDHPVVEAALHGEPLRFTLPELALRRELGLPPASALALLSGTGAPAFGAALSAGAAGRRPLEVSELVGERWLVRASDHDHLCDALAAVERPAGTLRVEVDPLEV